MTTTPYDDDADDLRALGVVIEEERGSLPFALLHGEALVTCAAWALGDSGVTPVDLGTEWAGLVDGGEPFVVHDSLCPMTPATFIASCLARAVATGAVVVAVHAAADATATVDRDGRWSVCSPVVLPATVVGAVDGLPSLDFVELARVLAERFPVEYVEAPPEARRVADLADVELLAAATRPEPG